MPRDNSTLDFVDEYLEHELVIFPLGFGSKLAKIPAMTESWKEVELTKEQLVEYFKRPYPNNMALKLTANNGRYKYADVDIDCNIPDIGELVQDLLPRTSALVGRESKWFGHYIYDITDYQGILETRQFRDPYDAGSVDSKPKKAVRKKGDDDDHDPTVMVELRTGIHYVMVAPSTHNSGEKIYWHDYQGHQVDFVKPTSVNYDYLTHCVRLVSGAIFVANHWPGEGSRHNTTLFLAGGLIAGGVEIELVEKFIRLVLHLVNDTSEVEDRIKAIQSTYNRFANGDTIAGWGALTEYIGTALVNYLRDMLYLPSHAGVDAEDRYSDRGNARRLLRMFPNRFRYAPEIKRFFIWKGTHWAQDIQNEVEAYYKQVIDTMLVEATQLRSMEHRKKLSEFAIKCDTSARMGSAITFLKTEPEVNTLLETFDADLDLFNFQNGTLNLATGEFLPHDPKHYISQVCPYDYRPDADCPMFKEFLLFIMDGNENLVDYLQRMFGYCLTGYADLKAMHFLYGPTTDNGKTTLNNIMSKVFGSQYCGIIPYDLLMQKKFQSNELNWLLVTFRNKRLALVTEPDKNTRLNEGKIKSLTGRNTQVVRSMYTGYDSISEYLQKFKLVVETNDLPLVSANSDAMWNRLRVVPFTVQIPKEKQIAAFEDVIIEHEAEGVLAWLVLGAKKYYESHDVPAITEVVIATQSHRLSMDVLQEFIDDSIEFVYEDKKAGVKVHRELVTVVRQAYFDYMYKLHASEAAYSKKEFEVEMERKGFQVVMFANNRYYKDVKLIRQSSMSMEFYGGLNADTSG